MDKTYGNKDGIEVQEQEDNNKYDGEDNDAVGMELKSRHKESNYGDMDVDVDTMNKHTRASHYEMLYQKVLTELASGEYTKKKTTIVISEDLWKLANIEAAFQQKHLSDVISDALVKFIKTNNGS